MIPNVSDRTVTAIMDRHRALAVLTTLTDDGCNGAAPDGVLADVLDTLGLGCSRVRLRACLDRLEQSGLVTLTPNGSTTVVRLTEQGGDVAQGRARANGVQPLDPPGSR